MGLKIAPLSFARIFSGNFWTRPRKQPWPLDRIPFLPLRIFFQRLFGVLPTFFEELFDVAQFTLDVLHVLARYFSISPANEIDRPGHPLAWFSRTLFLPLHILRCFWASVMRWGCKPVNIRSKILIRQ
jgi:hypothetical protein